LTFVSDEKLNAYFRISKLAVFPYTSFNSQSGATMRAAGHGLSFIATGKGGLYESDEQPNSVVLTIPSPASVAGDNCYQEQNPTTHLIIF